MANAEEGISGIKWSSGGHGWTFNIFDLSRATDALRPSRELYPTWDPNSQFTINALSTKNKNFRYVAPEPIRTVTSPSAIVVKPKVRIYGDYQYKYQLGLSHVEMGLDTAGYRGVFVSKPLPIRGGVGEVRLKSSHTNYEETLTSKHNPILTSIEYSVSNVSIPDKEEHWIPIMPSGERQVISERCFFDASGFCRFRFIADPVRTIDLFRNGYIVEFSVGQYLVRNERGGVTGITIPTNVLHDGDYYTVHYYPVQESDIVNFTKSGQDVIVSVPFAKNGKVGEHFTGTNQYQIQLSEDPFVDYSQVLQDEYVPGVGMRSYVPVWIRFDNNNRTAQNITNYRPNEPQSSLTQTNIFPNNPRFIHSGNVLLFDQVISDPFTVYYHYLGDTLRFRVVMRCNTSDFVSPSVDFVHIKAKTALPDALRG